MDDIERAQEREQFDRGTALAQAQRRSVVSTPADGRCLDCGEPIEPARIRVLGATEVCAACALVRDQRARRHG